MTPQSRVWHVERNPLFYVMRPHSVVGGHAVPLTQLRTCPIACYPFIGHCINIVEPSFQTYKLYCSTHRSLTVLKMLLILLYKDTKKYLISKFTYH